MAVQERVLRATAGLRAANMPYAVVGGNAVASWVGQRDPAAIRNTRDVDILVNRDDVPAIKQAMAKVGFVHWNGPGFDVFRDHIDADLGPIATPSGQRPSRGFGKLNQRPSSIAHKNGVRSAVYDPSTFNYCKPSASATPEPL